jgi:hypothetical protein
MEEENMMMAPEAMENEAPAEAAAPADMENMAAPAAPAEMEKEANTDDKASEKAGLLAVSNPMESKAAGEALGAFGFGGGANDNGSDNSVKRKITNTPCCCCLCQCSNEVTERENCFFCLPIKAGVFIIGFLTVLIALAQFSEAYWGFLNVTLPWWYVAVNLFLFVPAVVSVCFWIGFYTKDCRRTRSTIFAATIQSLVSYTLIVVWHVIFYLAIYKRSEVAIGAGNDADHYKMQSKKSYVYGQLVTLAFALIFYSYAIITVNAYCNCYPEEEPKDEKNKAK